MLYIKFPGFLLFKQRTRGKIIRLVPESYTRVNYTRRTKKEPQG